MTVGKAGAWFSGGWHAARHAALTHTPAPAAPGGGEGWAEPVRGPLAPGSACRAPVSRVVAAACGGLGIHSLGALAASGLV